ncbi:MAG: caspase family protein [Hyphomicrobiales bacterium]|nr:caspase family protein [Hyphomicrobiales bacterium]
MTTTLRSHLCAGLGGLLVVACLLPSAAAAESWRRRDYGGVAFETPADLRPFGGSEPGKLAAGADAWDGVALSATRNGVVERSLLVVVGWGESSHAYSDSDGVTSRATAISLGGRPAVRIDFSLKDQWNDTRGVDLVVVEPPLYGRRFVLTCRGPGSQWKTLKPVCDRIAASLEFRGATTVAATPPPPPPPPPPPTPPIADAKPPVPVDAGPAAAPPTSPKPTAAPPPDPAAVAPGRRVALVVGNGAYVAAPRLPTPATDADRMAAKLQGLGFEVILGRDLARGAMTADLADWFAKAQGAKIALFYFSGHGIQVKGRNYLLPTDADFTAPGAAFDVEARAVDLQKFLDAADGAEVVLAFIDACRDNPVVEEKLAQTFYKGLGGPTKGLAVVPKELVRKNRFLVFASEEGKTAETGTGEVSVFTAALLDNLGRPGEDVSVAYRKIRAAVEDATGGRQSPRSVDDLRAETILAPGR